MNLKQLAREMKITPHELNKIVVKLQFKKDTWEWEFSENQIIKIKEFATLQNKWISECGDFLIIQSKL